MMLPALEPNEAKAVRVLVKLNQNRNSPERLPEPGGNRNRLPKQIDKESLH